MAHLHLGWESDLDFKLRFLELIFLITTILIAIRAGSIAELSKYSLLMFLVFGTLHYFVLSNAILENRLVISTAVLTSFSFSLLFSGIFFQMNVLGLEQAFLYWFSIGLVIGLAILPRKTLDTTRYRVYQILDR